MASPRTISDDFNEKRYSPDPTNWGEVRGGDSIRKVVTEKRQTVGVVVKNPNQVFAANDPRHQTIDQTFNKSYKDKGVQPQNLEDKQESIRSKQEKLAEREKEESNNIEVKNNSLVRRLAKISPVKYGRAAVLAAALDVGSEVVTKAKAGRVTMWIWSVGTYCWLWVQLPIAIISVICFSLAVLIANELNSTGVTVVSTIWDALKVVAPGANILSAIGTYLIPTVLEGYGIVAEDITIFEPLFLITYLFIIAFAIFQLIIIYMVYKLISLEPLGGKAAGFKISMFILAFVGYCIPLLNILPWYMVWTGVVWLKPK
ncbi:hypothetical protein H6785_02650 [Candidatus Nomurabacteria bacterium]|nr:hypothetical protein [Candidatus Kaiserbacteria bacterium]MCB9815449.1 hypothetical protein [Candidatus Nomurabacteria bacterium]